VIDLDNLWDSGFAGGYGQGGGISVGGAFGFQYIHDEYEGISLEADINAGDISPSGGVTMSDAGEMTGGYGGLSIGPGVGVAVFVNHSESYTLCEMGEDLTNAWNTITGFF